MLRQGKNMVDRTQICNVEIWIEKKLTLLNARIVITGNTLLLKYKRQAITAVIGADGLILLTAALIKVVNIPSVNLSCKSGHFTDLE